MSIRMKIKNIKSNIKWKFQRAKKGYCDYDLYDINGWFINIFPKMLKEFAECTCGHPMHKETMQLDICQMPAMWVSEQAHIINRIGKEYDYTLDISEGMCCWLLILLRMKYCFEMCDEWHKDYEMYNNSQNPEDWEKQANLIEEYKKEGFYYFQKYFFNLWW